MSTARFFPPLESIVWLLAALLIGCGSSSGDPAPGGGPGPNPGNGAIALTGVVVKGAAGGAEVKVFTIDAGTGVKLAEVASTQADAAGRFATSFDGVAGPVRIEATGTHRDEATGQNLPIPAERPLVALFNAVVGDNSVSVSGVTTIHAGMVAADVTDVGVHVAEAIANAAITLQDFYEIGNIFAEPRLGAAVDDGTKLLAFNAGLSQLGADLGVDPLAVIEALGRDVAIDFQFDGQDRGEPLDADGAALPADAGTAGLADAIERVSGSIPTTQGGVIDATVNFFSSLFSGPEKKPCKKPEIDIAGRPPGTNLIAINGTNLDAGGFPTVTVDGRTALPRDETVATTPDGLQQVVFLIPLGTDGLADIVLANGKGQIAVIRNVDFDDNLQVEFNDESVDVSPAGGTPVEIEGKNLDKADLTNQNDEPIPTIVQSERRVIVPAPGQDQGDFPAIKLDQDGVEFASLDPRFKSEPESDEDRAAKFQRLAGKWCFFVAVRGGEGEEDENHRFEAQFDPSGTASVQALNANGSPLGNQINGSLTSLGGNRVVIPGSIDGVPAVLPMEIGPANNFMLGSEKNGVVVGFKKSTEPDQAAVLKSEYNVATVAELAPENTAAPYVGTLSWNEDKSEANFAAQRVAVGPAYADFAGFGVGRGLRHALADGAGQIVDPNRPNLVVNYQIAEGGKLIGGWYTNDDDDCCFRGFFLAMAKADQLSAQDLGGTWGGIGGTWDPNGAKTGSTYVAGASSIENKGRAATLTEFREILKETPSFISASGQTELEGFTREQRLTACGFIKKNNGVITGTADGDLVVEFQTGFGSVLLGPPIPTFDFSIRVRPQEFHSIHTFEGDMNEVEFAVDSGFGASSNDIAVRTRTVRTRQLSTSVRFLESMGSFNGTIDLRNKIVSRPAGQAETVTGNNTSDNFFEAYTVIADHMFVVPVAQLPGQSTDGVPPVIAQGKIAANGDFCVLGAPHERHGVMFRVLGKKTETAPALAGMTYHVGCIAFLFDDEGGTVQEAVRGTLTFNANGTFDATLRVRTENFDGGAQTVVENVSGTFVAENDGRVTITPDGGSPLKGFVTRGGDALFLVNADESTTESEFCVLVKQATQLPAEARVALTRLSLKIQTINPGFFLASDFSRFQRDGTDFDIQGRTHDVPGNFGQGVTDPIDSDATSTRAADGTFDVDIDEFFEFRGALSENGVIGFLMPGRDNPSGADLQILLGN